MQAFERVLPLGLEPLNERVVGGRGLALVLQLLLARGGQTQPCLVLLTLDLEVFPWFGFHDYIVAIIGPSRQGHAVACACEAAAFGSRSASVSWWAGGRSMA